MAGEKLDVVGTTLPGTGNPTVLWAPTFAGAIKLVTKVKMTKEAISFLINLFILNISIKRIYSPAQLKSIFKK